MPTIHSFAIGAAKFELRISATREAKSFALLDTTYKRVRVVTSEPELERIVKLARRCKEDAAREATCYASIAPSSRHNVATPALSESDQSGIDTLLKTYELYKTNQVFWELE